MKILGQDISRVNIGGSNLATGAKISGRRMRGGLDYVAAPTPGIYHPMWDGAAKAKPVGAYDVVVDYGADPTGATDSTAAIVAALDAAGAVASAEDRKVVYIPEGEYKVIPTGYMLHIKWEKVNGAWRYYNETGTYYIANYKPIDNSAAAISHYGVVDGDYVIYQIDNNQWLYSGGVWSAQGAPPAWYEPRNETLGTWHFYDVEPTALDGADGDHWICRTENKVWLKTAGAWAVESVLIEGSGAGWSADFRKPNDADGVDGDIYIQYQLRTTAPFRVTEDWNHVTLMGAGVRFTKLNYRCWDDIDPNDYSVDGETIIHTKIPPSGWYPAGGSGPDDTRSNRSSRTEFFIWDRDNSANTLNGFHIEDIEADGACSINDYNHGWYSFAQYLDQWDINQKGCTFSYGADGNIFGVEITRCYFHHIRGEIFYAGGGNEKHITITGCEVSHTKASAISISGNLTVVNCYGHDLYNGFENYALASHNQYTDISGCTIEVGSGDGFGIVYIGDKGTPYCNITNTKCVGGNAGLFLSDFASDVTINGLTIEDSGWGIYVHYMDLYNKSAVYDDISINNLTLHGKNKVIGVGILLGLGANETWQSASNWSIDGVTVLTGVTKFLSGGNITPLPTVANASLGNSMPIDGSVIAAWDYATITSKALDVNAFTASSGVFPLTARAPKYNFVFIPDQTAPGKTGRSVALDLSGGLSRFPVGYRTNIKLTLSEAQTSTAWLLVAADWNAFAEDIQLANTEEIDLVVNADKKWEVYVAP